MSDGLSRFERSCMLVKASWDVLRADRGNGCNETAKHHCR